MELKDYLHLYLGCPVHSMDGGSMTYTLSGIDRKGNAMFYDGHGNEMWLSNWKLHLRPLSDMTMEDVVDLVSITHPDSDLQYSEFEFVLSQFKKGVAINFDEVPANNIFNGVAWLLSKHFDIFNLIPAGLAIDSTTLKPSTK